ncbi:GNAT family N-acetyltransferase [Devosia sp. BK]|uniref:GNAT family N-acetyltransferase n=1 Tax=Devosia sp. BK TaxID=2871706 RepID=UPI00293B7814|nr:GNAT family N-acetyltransferase [Devosia sp. BK]MDV3253185.1 GNAT family N-acetyltransferase [Devosia sp. BK]
MIITTGLLIDHTEAMSALVDLYESEWADWYNPRGASARADLTERLERNRLPLGIVAFADGQLAGTCALTVMSGGLTERSPWLGGLLVEPALRRHGVGLALLDRAKVEAKRLGFSRLHALTAEARQLFERAGWRLAENVEVGGKLHGIYVAVL